MADFLERLSRRDLTVGVVGLGYVGLPLVIGFAEAGFAAVGFDVDEERVARLNRGQSHIEDIDSDRVGAQRDAGRFAASCEPSDLAACDAVFISVPTPFDEAKTPDLTFVRAAAETVADALHPGMLVILQSTTYPGTTTEVVQPILEAKGLVAGRDFWLAFSPERVDPGNETWTLRNTPKVVGGVDTTSAELAAALLESCMDAPGLVRVLSSPAAAEMTKLLENIYRAVNIALVNELAVLADRMDIDIWEVIDGAATKPFGFQPFYPGIGPGGHCIPVDPYYLSWKARAFDFQTKFIELAADTNLGMADYVVGRVQGLLNRRGKALSGSKVLVMGAAFKPQVSDVRNSRAARVIELLAAAGASVRYCDSFVPTLHVGRQTLKSVEPTPEELGAVDCIAILVGHHDLPRRLLAATGTPVFDAVNALGADAGAHVERL